MTQIPDRVRRVAVVTIGVFDGVHAGHQQLLRRVAERAVTRGAEGVCVTFDPHPEDVLRPEAAIVHLAPLEDRLSMIKRMGIGEVLLMEFTRDLAQMSPEQFMDLLLERFQIAELWIGSDFALGKDRAGGPERLAEIGSSHGFEVHQFPPVYVGGEVVSSSRIRRALADGRVEEVAVLLGRRYRLRGEVVAGDRRGRQLGFPTANLAVAERLAIPGDGVYAVTCSLDDRAELPGVASIGVRPTFGGGNRQIEIHLLGFQGDLYGRRMSVDFVAFLREELRFSSADALVRQMVDDVERAKALLGVDASS